MEPCVDLCVFLAFQWDEATRRVETLCYQTGCSPNCSKPWGFVFCFGCSSRICRSDCINPLSIISHRLIERYPRHPKHPFHWLSQLSIVALHIQMERLMPYFSAKRDRCLAEVKSDRCKLSWFHTQTITRLSTKRMIGLVLPIQLLEESCKIS